MNELEFKRHLKALVHGHHHPEEHDWDSSTGKPQKKAAATPSRPKRRVAKKALKRK
jgi:hypothetical protein